MCDYQGHEFGATYPDSVCIEGFLWDADSGDACGDGWIYTNGGEIPCPKCNTEAYNEHVRECEGDDSREREQEVRHVIPPSFDEKLVEEALAATELQQ